MSGAQPSSGLVDGKCRGAVAPDSSSERLMMRVQGRVHGDFVWMCRPGQADTVLGVGESDARVMPPTSWNGAVHSRSASPPPGWARPIPRVEGAG